MVTSRSVAQSTEQMLSDFAGQNLLALRFWQIGQINFALLRGGLPECAYRGFRLQGAYHLTFDIHRDWRASLEHEFSAEFPAVRRV